MAGMSSSILSLASPRSLTICTSSRLTSRRAFSVGGASLWRESSSRWKEGQEVRSTKHGWRGWTWNALDEESPADEEGRFSLEEETEKLLQGDESQALLRDLAAAAQRVEASKRELDAVRRKEKQISELQAFLEHLDAEQAAADSMAKVTQDVLEAEAEMKAAELALVTARAGDLSTKWVTEVIDEDAERVESGKAAAVSTLAGTLASLPFSLVVDGGWGLGTLLSQGGIVLSCLLFGVTYRYIIRRDLGNLQLKSGAVAAFGLVRGIGQIDATQALVGFSETGIDKVLTAALEAGESMIIFAFAALAVDYCLRERLVSPFPSQKPHGS
ncbi:unnamed protein product [Sphagnum troendelagicum]|uniref:Uncharacterized protein n=1 Tax=Sphagnum troendelagicum TaxID=128251 RepID=A0ABP0UPR1_9BRYO